MKITSITPIKYVYFCVLYKLGTVKIIQRSNFIPSVINKHSVYFYSSFMCSYRHPSKFMPIVIFTFIKISQ